MVAGRLKAIKGGSADPSMNEAPSNDKMPGDHAPKPTPIPAAGSPTTGNASRQVTRDEGATLSSSDLSSQGSASEMFSEISVKKRIDQFENISIRANASTTDPQEISPNNGEKEHRHLGTSSGNDLNVTTPTPKPTSIPVTDSTTTGNASRQVTGNEEATTSSFDLSSQGSASEMSPEISVKKRVAPHENCVKMSTAEPQEMSPNNGETASGNNPKETPATSTEPTDPNFFQKCRAAIDRVLRLLTKKRKKIASFYKKLTTSSKGSESTDDKASSFSNILNSMREACTVVKFGLVFVIDGELCVWDIKELWEQRNEREITPKEFIERVCMMASEALVNNGLQTAGKFAGRVAGQIAGTYLAKKTGVGSIIAGMLGCFVGGFVGGIVGVFGSWLVAMLTEKLVKSAHMNHVRVVIKINDLKPGDQVIIPNDASQLPSHAIIFKVLKTSNAMRLIRDKSGCVVEETVLFDPKIKRVEFKSEECRPPHEVVAMASRYIGKQFNSKQRSRDGREFAMMCKLTCIHEELIE